VRVYGEEMECLSIDLETRHVPFSEGLALQRSIHAAVASQSTPASLIMLQHEPVYTAGRRTRAAERPAHLNVEDVDRGGKITWHGPGQLVVYPIVPLPAPLDVVKYVRQLERAVIDLCEDLSVAAHTVNGRSGVWVDSPLPGIENKVCAIGVRVAQGVTMHGLALNCSNSLEPYSHIVACGIADAGVTTLSLQAGRTITVQECAPRLMHHLELRLKEIGIV